MSLPKDLNDFKENHCTTLIADPNSNSFFVRVNVADYNELSIIKTNLLTAIKLIADYNQLIGPSNKGDITYSIGTLVQLLRNFGLEEESDGLSELIIKNR
ncbi:MAG: hypothetical protein GQ574_12570 [Crocinitomix sp.]|nr:hypothetical protein [Crocinitomix sp.]